MKIRRATVAAAAVSAACLAAFACAPVATPGGAGARPDAATAPGATAGPTYYVYVGAESADLLHRVAFTPGAGARVEQTIETGRMPTENEGPHGIGISPDGRYLYLTTGHGVPDGKLWKYELGPDTLVAPEVGLGFFPATTSITPDGLFAFVVNFNLHGEMVPSSVSVVYTPDMVEIERTTTCTMPHGSRINPSGTRHYSACMMDDQLVEIDTRTFDVARRFSVAAGQEGPIAVPMDETMGGMREGMGTGMRHRPTCSPTWAEPSVDGASVYVACNAAGRILEVDVATWSLVRTFDAGRAPYNLEATADGRLLIATLKGEAAVQFFDLRTGQALAKTPSTTTVTHGVVASPDSRFAFVSVEGVGAEPGKVDVYDLDTFRRVASVAVGQQAGGIGFWKVER